MSIAETTKRVHERFRARLKRLIEREKSALGCKMAAVKAVAAKLGKSRAWVHRVINEHRAPVAVDGVRVVLAIAHCFAPFVRKRRSLPPLTLNLSLKEKELA